MVFLVAYVLVFMVLMFLVGSILGYKLLHTSTFTTPNSCFYCFLTSYSCLCSSYWYLSSLLPVLLAQPSSYSCPPSPFADTLLFPLEAVVTPPPTTRVLNIPGLSTHCWHKLNSKQPVFFLVMNYLMKWSILVNNLKNVISTTALHIRVFLLWSKNQQVARLYKGP